MKNNKELEEKFLKKRLKGSEINFSQFPGSQNIIPMYQAILGAGFSSSWDSPSANKGKKLPSEGFLNMDFPKVMFSEKTIIGGKQHIIDNMGEMYLEQEVAWWEPGINGGPKISLRFDHDSEFMEFVNASIGKPSSNNSLRFATWSRSSIVNSVNVSKIEEIKDEIHIEFNERIFDPVQALNFWKIMNTKEGPSETDFTSAILAIKDKRAVMGVYVNQSGFLNGCNFSISKKYSCKNGILKDEHGRELSLEPMPKPLPALIAKTDSKLLERPGR